MFSAVLIKEKLEVQTKTVYEYNSPLSYFDTSCWTNPTTIRQRSWQMQSGLRCSINRTVSARVAKQGP
jgi:hypothetical protein